MTQDQIPDFDFQDSFGDDYYYFYQQSLTAERNEREAEAICRLLALEPGKSLLDLGCGYGRISNILAERGLRVSGIDSSRYFLDLARKDATFRGVDVDYVEGDMRNIPWEAAFDAVLIWFTTFGYFSDADNERVLHQVKKALKPNGRTAIEQLNRVVMFRGSLPTSFVVQRGDDLMIDNVDYDGLTDRSLTERVVVRNGRVKRTKHFVRLYSPSELFQLLRKVGFQSVQIFGRNGEPFTLYGNRLIAVGVA